MAVVVVGTPEPPDDDAFRRLLESLPQESLLTRDDEVWLARLIEAGRADDASDDAVATGEAARGRLNRANLRLVVAVARRYAGRGLSPDELVEAGRSGLDAAIDTFDWRKGFKFSTYTTWWIRRAINGRMERGADPADAPVADDDLTVPALDPSDLPANVVAALGSLRADEQEVIGLRFGLVDGRAHTLDEVAERAGLTREEVRAVETRFVERLRRDPPSP